MHRQFHGGMRKLFLDDIRKPPDQTWDVVRSYTQFVAYIEANGVPDVISFDHDLAFEHYPLTEENPDPQKIPYEKYAEKTGYDCAKWLIESGYEVKRWMVHSMNVKGAENIRFVLSKAGMEVC